MIPHNKPTLGNEENIAASKVLKSGWLAQGTEVAAFENEFCKFLGLPENHAVAVSSGTAALYLALWVMEAIGKKIILPVYVCSALRHAIAMIGGKEVLKDVSDDSPNINLDSGKIKKSEIAIVPHMFGIPFDLKKYKNHSIIEDCAQSLGASIDCVQTGLHGKVGIFSFYATKLITSGGQGGMIVSKNKSIVDSIRDYREFDCRHDSKRRFNFQMTDLQAAIGREQLKKLPEFLEKREQIFSYYKESGFPMLDLDKKSEGKIFPVRYRAILKTGKSGKIMESLHKAGIRAIVPIETWELLGRKELFPNAAHLTLNTLSLPVYPSLKTKDVKLITRIVKANL